MNGEQEPRCLSACEVELDVLKRCQKDAGHSDVHLWLSAADDSGERLLAIWSDDYAVQPDRAWVLDQ